jgi:hypothetical protein
MTRMTLLARQVECPAAARSSLPLCVTYFVPPPVVRWRRPAGAEPGAVDGGGNSTAVPAANTSGGNGANAFWAVKEV